MLTEAKINKLLEEVWKNTSAIPPSSYIQAIRIGGSFTNKRKGRFYKKNIDGFYIRVYKKYGYMPKPKEK